MPVAILGAVEQEISRLIGDPEGDQERVGERAYHRRTLHGSDVILVHSGLGKVASSSTVTSLLDRFDAEQVIFVGVAGAISPDLNIGDVVIATELVQHDIDARPLFARFERFATDPDLRDRAELAARDFIATEVAEEDFRKTLKGFGVESPKVVRGLIASGDQFIADMDPPAGPIRRLARFIVRRLGGLVFGPGSAGRRADAASLRRDHPGLLCVEMEGAAVAQVCDERGTPFVVIRVISDYADHTAGLDFLSFVENVASIYSEGILRRLLPEMRKAV